ncbi:hypothetical protein D3Y57_06975 [Sphingomonas paeninsulae]|uniref:Uncharacterized protein n=1 Tax=Sphingomonas paeninsulae TaxID=2319844 RepID=A0A494T9V6_SPHPE|nr:hypothetical protein [Sphingomonas paeninsulae]AYJ85760.1 hypothetical protein D3Y57_06975 [Sphingomonas paeninsulae]
MMPEDLAEIVEVSENLIRNTKTQIELTSRYMNAPQMRSLKLVLLKLDEARLWMGEVGQS